MEPPTCSLCGNLDYDGIAALMVKAGTWGRVPYHWMSSDELRASAAGILGNRHSGSQKQSPKRCKTCALLRDAAESFLRGSSLAGSNASVLDYSVALQNPSSAALRQSLELGDKSGKAGHRARNRRQERNLDKLGDDGDKAYHSDGGDSADSWQSLGESRKAPASSKVPALKLLLRCNLTPPKAKSQEDSDEQFQLELFTSAKEPVPNVPMVGTAGEVLSELRTEDYVNTIKEWLRLCDENHWLCIDKAARPGCPKLMPKRILDISNNKIFLSETSTKKGLYIALSHCWGNEEQIPVMKKNNIAERMKNIPFDSMPRSFQDAIQISRALGVQYLWIDSLCIIQDDANDWQEQAGQMKDIYGFCYLNIAATRAGGAKEGFLGPRWTSQDVSPWAQSTNPNPAGAKGAPTKSKIRQLKPDSYPVSNKDEPSLFSKDLHGTGLRVRLAVTSSHESLLQPSHNVNSHNHTAPLNQRAWFFQERSLAPRTVHFHANELMWECYSGESCECTTLNGLAVSQKTLSVWGMSKSMFAALESHHSCEDVLQTWRRLVEDYTTRDLTYETDRLPALAGLASWTRALLRPGDEYLAGLWKLSLGRDLLWEVEADSKVSRRLENGKKSPPSWSWASLVHDHTKPGLKYVWEARGGTETFLEDITYVQDSRFSVKSASCSLVDSSSPYGHVSGGSITVTGAMCAVALVEDTAPIPQVWRDQIPIKSRYLFDSLQLNYDDPRDGEAVLNKDNPTRGLIFCLYIGTFEHRYSLDPVSHPSRKGLILQPSKTVPGAAERIGCWTQFIEKWAVGTAVFPLEATPVSVTIV